MRKRIRKTYFYKQELNVRMVTLNMALENKQFYDMSSDFTLSFYRQKMVFFQVIQRGIQYEHRQSKNVQITVFLERHIITKMADQLKVFAHSLVLVCSIFFLGFSPSNYLPKKNKLYKIYSSKYSFRIPYPYSRCSFSVLLR